MNGTTNNSKTPDMTIRNIEAAQTVAIRHRVLWPSIPIEGQLLPYDSLSSTTHYGAFASSNDAAPIACLTITLEPYKGNNALPTAIAASLPDGSRHYQLHKYAVLPEYQRRRVGKRLLLHAVEALTESVRQEGEQACLFHFDARLSQIGVYEHLGFGILDEERFMKHGSTGKEVGVEYVRMGKVIRCA